MAGNDSSFDVHTADSDDLEFWRLRRLRFRVLILGRANAGKTTILERIAGASIGEAEVWRDRKRLPGQIVKGQSDRGLHNVKDEIRFPSRPGFVFHDSRGFEAGSSEELDAARRFVEDSAEVTNLKEQLHAVWMCLPLDKARELFDTEKQVFSWTRGHIPLVVIFTKRDGAVDKVTSQIISSASESASGRAFRKKARENAEIAVTTHIKEREEELRQLDQVAQGKSAMAFLATSDMAEPTDVSESACANLIKATEEGLAGPKLKTVLSLVWGRNLLKNGFWCFFW
ncbi:hypothetical protein M422DRAFT_35304 [Sphaerobolus stellatus SS14]|uniref:G domain-containing protein n=1 Tax=Sphaerobolus stellatus (strain SS14) TaxID=990650 RepID=A0A0C9V982_SPHS4|nr:hypothetical protein M422DRAFT_35304 [Sphaerobolus stellatus SS14]